MGAHNYQDLARHAGHTTGVVTHGEGASAAVECLDCGTVLMDFDNVPLKGQTVYVVDHAEGVHVLPDRDQAATVFSELLAGGARNLCVFVVRVVRDGMTWRELGDTVTAPPGVFRFNLADEMTDADALDS